MQTYRRHQIAIITEAMADEIRTACAARFDTDAYRALGVAERAARWMSWTEAERTTVMRRLFPEVQVDSEIAALVARATASATRRTAQAVAA